MQDKLHGAITGQTAAELIDDSADVTKLFIGLTTWKHAPAGKTLESDVSVAENYPGGRCTAGRTAPAQAILLADHAIASRAQT